MIKKIVLICLVAGPCFGQLNTPEATTNQMLAGTTGAAYVSPRRLGPWITGQGTNGGGGVTAAGVSNIVRGVAYIYLDTNRIARFIPDTFGAYGTVYTLDGRGSVGDGGGDLFISSFTSGINVAWDGQATNYLGGSDFVNEAPDGSLAAVGVKGSGGWVKIYNGIIKTTNENGVFTADGGNVTASGDAVFGGALNVSGGAEVDGSLALPGLAAGNALVNGYLTMNDDGNIRSTFDLSLGVYASARHLENYGDSTDTGLYLGVDTSGNTYLTNTPPNIGFPQLPVGSPTAYTGLTNIGNLATSLLIKINHTMPNTNYVPSVSFISAALGAGISSSYSSITPTNFTVNLSAGIAGGEPLRWSVIYSP